LSRPLFRPEAIEFQQHHRQWGNVASLQPLSSKLVAWFLAASTVAIFLFLCGAQYSRKETVVGYLTPTTGTAKIFAPQRGTIRKVYVQQGDSVKESEPLLTIETDQIGADNSDINASMLKTLDSQRDLLAKNMKAEEQRTASERERLSALVSGLQTEISQLQSQLKLQAERQSVAQSDLSAAEQLKSKGFMTQIEYRRRQMNLLEQQQAASTLDQQLAERRNRLVETQYSLQQLPTVMAQNVQNIRNELATAEQRIAEINGRRAYVIRAPTAGLVSTLQATVGESADPERLQLEIIPQNAVLQAELLVPARAIGFVTTGQTIRILYEAFPYQHFGTYGGHIVKVSQTLLTGADAAGPIALKEPAYKVTASIARSDIDANGKKIPLQPDMLLRADIILEKRSLLDWLTSPLRGVRM
jgi:membrane fusion protein